MRVMGSGGGKVEIDVVFNYDSHIFARNGSKRMMGNNIELHILSLWIYEAFGSLNYSIDMLLKKSLDISAICVVSLNSKYLLIA